MLRTAYCAVSIFAASMGATPDLRAAWNGWTLDGPGRIEPAGDLFGLSYESPRFEPITLRPPHPIALGANVTRLGVWYAREAGDFDLVFLVRDAAGKEHAVGTATSRPEFPAVRRSRMRYWSIWNAAESVDVGPADDMKDRVQPEYAALAQRGVWPRPLALAGLRVVPARDRRDNEAHPEQATIRAGRGKLWLADLTSTTTTGLEARYNWLLVDRSRWGWDCQPRLFLDDLTIRSGPLRYAVEISHGYQGPVVWRQAGEGTLDRHSPGAIFADRIELPELPAGHYFVRLKSWTAGGVLDRSDAWRLFVVRGPAAALPEAETPLRWETGQPNHVFRPETTVARLTLRIAAGAWPERSDCQVAVRDWLGRPLLEKAFPQGPAIAIDCPGVAEGQDYRAAAEWRRNGRVVERADLHFGVANRTAGRPAVPRAGLPTRDDLLLSRKAVALAEHWGSLLSSRRAEEPLTVESVHDFDRWLDQAAGLGFKYVSLAFGWGEVEPLPGVRRWAEIERRVELARQRGLQMFLTPTEWGHPLEWPEWLAYQPMLDQHGHVADYAERRLPQPSIADAAARRGEMAWLEAVAGRFAGSPTVIGYRTKPRIYAASNKPEFTQSDYARPMQEAFGKWLVAQGQAAGPIPRPFVVYPFSPVRLGPDLSPGWQRFMRFRTQCYEDSVRDIMSHFRTVDPVRQIHIYRSSTSNAPEAAIPLLADGGEFHDEGGPFYFQRALESMCLQAGVPYTNEGHQFTPPSRAMADAGFFYGSCFDRGWYWLYRWNVHRAEDARFAALPDVLRFVQSSLPAMSEWVAGHGDTPQVLVFGSRADRLLGAPRHGFYAEIAGLDVFTALWSYHQVPAHFANEHTDWVAPGRFKLVVASGDVLTTHAIERLAAHARGGGKLLLVGDAGRLCAEEPAARDVLAKRVAGMAGVRRIAAPSVDPPPPGEVARGGKALDPVEFDRLLEWAGVIRRVRTADPGFDCVRKQSPDERQVLVAVFRRWPGAYENIWYDRQVDEKWGRRGTQVVLGGMADGAWRVEKLHRQRRSLGTTVARGGELRFEVDPAAVAELQLFRLEPTR